jgi:A/G-specific adenine glycosylase
MTPSAATRRLLAWFARNARHLPWRGEPRDPYRVLVSELMLQQTQVDRVVPLYEAFVARFPNLEALAAACEDEVLAAWSGLGYYRRARLLHRLAAEVVAGPGVLPGRASELEQLPGVGPYTAAAVASLAFGEREPVVDGNVLRVAARNLALTLDPRGGAGRRQVLAWVRGLMDGAPPGQVNEALMELGATVCRPRAPDCDSCPLAGDCKGQQLGSPDRYPPPRVRRRSEDHHWIAACCTEPGGRWLLRQVAEGAILRGLWLPPLAGREQGDDPVVRARALIPLEVDGEVRVLDPVSHSITHRRITVTPVLMSAREVDEPGAGWQWADPRRPGLATSTLLVKLAAAAK